MTSVQFRFVPKLHSKACYHKSIIDLNLESRYQTISPVPKTRKHGLVKLVQNNFTLWNFRDLNLFGWLQFTKNFLGEHTPDPPRGSVLHTWCYLWLVASHSNKNSCMKPCCVHILHMHVGGPIFKWNPRSIASNTKIFSAHGHTLRSLRYPILHKIGHIYTSCRFITSFPPMPLHSEQMTFLCKASVVVLPFYRSSRVTWRGREWMSCSVVSIHSGHTFLTSSVQL